MYFVYRKIIEKYLINDNGSLNSWALKRLNTNNPLIFKKIKEIYPYTLNEKQLQLSLGSLMDI